MMQFQGGSPLSSPSIDELLCCLADGRDVPLAMRVAGHTMLETSKALHNARLAGFVETQSRGRDRLTPAGKARVNQINAPRRTGHAAARQPSPSTTRSTF
jgi:hypothetical protein